MEGPGWCCGLFRKTLCSVHQRSVNLSVEPVSRQCRFAVNVALVLCSLPTDSVVTGVRTRLSGGKDCVSSLWCPWNPEKYLDLDNSFTGCLGNEGNKLYTLSISKGKHSSEGKTCKPAVRQREGPSLTESALLLIIGQCLLLLLKGEPRDGSCSETKRTQ